MQLHLSFDMLGRFLKNCAGIEKYQFCLWSGKVASKAKEAEVPEKAKKKHTVEGAGIYIYVCVCGCIQTIFKR